MTDPIAWTGTRIDRTDFDGSQAISSVMPSGASVGDRAIACVCAFGFESGYNLEDSTNPHMTPPDSSWLPFYARGEVDTQWSAGDNGYHDIWMFCWVKASLTSGDISGSMDWEANTNEDQSYSGIMVTQTFSGGEFALDYANLEGHHYEGASWDSSTAGFATSDGAALGATWLYSYFFAGTILSEPHTGFTPTATWTNTDGPNGGTNMASGGSLDSPSFGYYQNSGSAAPTCRLASEYHVTTVEPGVRLQMGGDSTDTMHGTMSRVPWLWVPGASSGGDIWGWGP